MVATLLVAPTAGTPMKRLYSEVSARIIAELEAGATPWIKPWSITPGANTPCNAMTNRPYSGCNVILLWMARMAGYRTVRFLTFKQALELGGHVRGTKLVFVKQLEIREEGDASTRLVPMLREYTVFNIDQCDGLPDSVTTGKPMRVRNPDTRDNLADQFLRLTGADIREDHGDWSQNWAPRSSAQNLASTAISGTPVISVLDRTLEGRQAILLHRMQRSRKSGGLSARACACGAVGSGGMTMSSGSGHRRPPR